MWNTTSFDVRDRYPNLAPSSIVYDPMSLTYTLSEAYKDGKRWYAYDNELYPSITTLLTETDTEGQRALTKWRTAIGHEAAQRVTTSAATNGTRWHNFCEQYVTGVPLQKFSTLLHAPTDLQYAGALTHVLNTHVRRVFASELRVMSTEYGIAGRMDIGAELMDGRYAIIDFKTGKKPKTGNRLTNYACQATFYADALTEQLSSGRIDTIVIVQLCPTTILWQESAPSYWREELRSRIVQFADIVNSRLDLL